MRKLIAFATPGAVDGGGIGRMTGYIVDHLAAGRGGPRTVVLDTRGGGSVLWSPFYLGAALVRLGALLRHDGALVHINVSERTSFLRKAAVQLVAMACSRPTVVHLHGASFIDFYRQNALARGISRWLFRRCDRLIVLGDAWRDFAVHTMGIDAGKVDVLYNAVPDFAGDGVRRDPPAPGRTLDLLTLANLSERKGTGCLLRACAQLKARGVRFRLTLGGGGDVAGYRRMAEDLGIGADCRFLGWVSRETAHELIRSHDLLLLPSTHEGLPMVILEALAARLPVVTTPVGSIPEVLDDGETALIVPVDDPQALGAAVATLADDPALYRRMAEAGRRLFVERFQIDGYCARLTAIYDLVHRRRGGIPVMEEVAALSERHPPASKTL
ncbi:MAG TPA: glycosyltransferase family 4 protein [Azospirillum sp.]